MYYLVKQKTFWWLSFLQSINKFVNLHLGMTLNQDVLSAQAFRLWLAHLCFCFTILPSGIIVAIGSVISTDVNRRTAWLCPSYFTWFPVWCYVIQRCEIQAVSLTTLLCSATCRGLTAPTRATPPFRFTERWRRNKPSKTLELCEGQPSWRAKEQVVLNGITSTSH